MNYYLKYFKSNPYITLAFLQVLAATIGSSIMSEVLLLVPCKLCWIQRLFMFPLPFIMGIAIWRKDKKIYQYVLPFSLIGGAIALYHSIIYYQSNYLYGYNETDMVACSGGVSCTTTQLDLFGFISIPLLSLIAFTVITLTMLLQRQSESR